MMTPKEKAKELVDKMYDSHGQYAEITFYEAIQCALIAVDEIIKNTTACYEDCFNHPQWQGGYGTKASQETIDYWKAVKLEIENIYYQR